MIVCMAAVITVQSSVQYERGPDTDPVLDFYYVPHPDYLRLVALGFDGFVADVYWIRSILYFGKGVMESDNDYMGYSLRDEDLNDPGYLEWKKESTLQSRYLYDMLNIVTDLDPYFRVPYTFGGLFLSMKANRPDLSVKLLEKGLKTLKGEWRIPYFLGFNYYFYLDEPLSAVDYFSEALKSPECPQSVIFITQKILLDADKRDVAIDFITGIRDKTENPDLRKELDDILEDLESESGIRMEVKQSSIN
ncbi:hypothetical protein ACFL5L_03295 [candidate division KSB1 bacterium]